VITGKDNIISLFTYDAQSTVHKFAEYSHVKVKLSLYRPWRPIGL
jgi:hypothetical protein